MNQEKKRNPVSCLQILSNWNRNRDLSRQVEHHLQPQGGAAAGAVAQDRVHPRSGLNLWEGDNEDVTLHCFRWWVLNKYCTFYCTECLSVYSVRFSLVSFSLFCFLSSFSWLVKVVRVKCWEEWGREAPWPGPAVAGHWHLDILIKNQIYVRGPGLLFKWMK